MTLLQKNDCYTMKHTPQVLMTSGHQVRDGFWDSLGDGRLSWKKIQAIMSSTVLYNVG